MGQTRGALKELLDAAPATATVLRGGQPVEVGRAHRPVARRRDRVEALLIGVQHDDVRSL